MTDECKAVLLHWARFHGELSVRLYASPCGADKPDAERHRMVAVAMRKLAGGEGTTAVLAWFQREWVEFMKENNAKVDAAPKIGGGPYGGVSAIHHRWADRSSGEQGETDIVRHWHDAAVAGAIEDSKAAARQSAAS